MNATSVFVPSGLCRLLAHPLLAWVAFVVAFASTGRAAVGHSLVSFTETNYTGYVVSSDVNNPLPLYDRDAIEARVAMQFTRSGAADHHYDYRYSFQLLNQAGVAQTLSGGGTVLAITESVNMTVGPEVINRLIDARIAPAHRLDPNDTYRVRVFVSRRVANPQGLFGFPLLTADTPAQAYQHFNQLVTGDAARNVLAEVASVSWTRLSRIQSDNTLDAFRVQAVVNLTRYDEFVAPAPVVGTVGTRLSVVLRDDLDNVIPLQQSTFEFNQNIATFDEATFVGEMMTRPRRPATNSAARLLDLRPVNQLLSRSRTYSVQVTVGHFESPGDAFPTAGDTLALAATRLLDFNGTLGFAGTSGTFTSIAAPGPQVGGLGANNVLTSLRIDQQSGSFQGLTFGNGTELAVRLFDSGIAQLDSGSLALSGIGFPVNPGAIGYSLEGLSVTPAAISGTVRLKLPSGLGVATDSLTRIHEPDVTFPGVVLNAQLRPVAATLSSPLTRWAAEESKPFIFESSALHWDVAAARLRFTATGNIVAVRAQAYAALLADVSLNANDRTKRSNDGYYNGLNAVTSAELVVTTDPANGSARLTCEVALGGSLYFAHFPLNALIGTSGGGQRIVIDQVDPTFGGLSGVDSVSLGYRRDCPDGGCDDPVGAQTLFFNPASNQLKFTRDGGLAASGTLNAPHTLQWGWVASANDFAQSAGAFTAAGFHASGLFLPFSEQGGVAVPATDQPARLLYTGVSPTAPNTVERPGGNAYKTGLGDYAGLNFRVVDWGDQDGKLVLAGQSTPPFPLTNRAKYVVRASGVTGIHEAINGEFAPTAVIYGLDFEFTSLGWAFLSGTPDAVASRTDGNLTVPFPSDFGLDFEKVRISCNGALLGAEIAAVDASSLKKLVYWNADFRPLSLAFQGKAAAVCDPSQRSLVLGVEA